MQPIIHNKTFTQIAPRTRLNQIAPINLPGCRYRANTATINFSWFYLHRINSEKINKTDSNISRFIFNFCYRHEVVLKHHGQAYLFKINTQKYLHDLSWKEIIYMI